MTGVPFLDRLGDELEAAVGRAASPRPQRDGWWIAAGAFVLVVLLGGGLALLAPTGETPPVQPSVTTTSSAPGFGPGIPDTWARVPAQPAVTGEVRRTLTDAAFVDGGRFIAVGTDAIGDVVAGVILESADGTTWTETARIEDLGLTAVETGGPAMVAAGNGTRRAGIAVSTDDGATWVVVSLPDPSVAPGQRALVRDVVYTGARYVAVGQVAPTVDTGGGPFERPVAWYSTDGMAWEPAGAFPDGVVADLSSVAVTPARTVVAVGLRGDDPAVVAPAAWWSSDGIEWQPANVLGEYVAGFTVMSDVAARPDVMVAVGSTRGAGGNSGVVWTSVDGLTWDRVDDPDGALASPVQFSETRLLGVAHVGDGFVATGNALERGASRMVLWTSPDGVRWDRLDLLDPADAAGGTTGYAVAPGGDGVVVTGASFGVVGSAGVSGAVWVGPATGDLVASVPYEPDERGPAGLQVAIRPDRAVGTTRLLVRGRLGDDVADVAGLDVWLRPSDGSGSVFLCSAPVQLRTFECRVSLADLDRPVPPGRYRLVLGGPDGVAQDAALEVFADGTPVPTLSGLLSPQFFPLLQLVTVRNDGAEDLDLSGWSIADAGRPEPSFTFPTGTVIAPEEAAVLNFAPFAGNAVCPEDTRYLFHWCRALGYTGIISSPIPDEDFLWNGGDLQLLDAARSVRATWDPTR